MVVTTNAIFLCKDRRQQKGNSTFLNKYNSHLCKNVVEKFQDDRTCPALQGYKEGIKTTGPEVNYSNPIAIGECIIFLAQ